MATSVNFDAVGAAFVGDEGAADLEAGSGEDPAMRSRRPQRSATHAVVAPAGRRSRRSSADSSAGHRRRGRSAGSFTSDACVDDDDNANNIIDDDDDDSTNALLLSDALDERHLHSQLHAARQAAAGRASAPASVDAGGGDGGGGGGDDDDATLAASRRRRVGGAVALLACACVLVLLLQGAVTGGAVDGPPVVASPDDHRKFDAFTLGNGLQVLVVSDPRADVAAAAVDVKVGSLADPPAYPGLAHFLEHMLFLGTAKYPDENAYTAYLSAHGGASNAYTDLEDTNYFFRVQWPFLDEALDRFAQFFVSPTLTEAAMDREMLAVSSEHAKNMLDDAWRQFQLMKHVSSPDAPFHQFATGNVTTLNRTGVRAALTAFHDAFYAARRMRLAVLGKDAIPELKAMVIESFDGVRAAGTPTGGFTLPPPAPTAAAVFPPSALGRVVSAVPVSDVHEVSLLFPLPSQYGRQATSALPYAMHLLGDDGPGSLSAYLKAAGKVDALTASVEVDTVGMTLVQLSLVLVPAYAATLPGPGTDRLQPLLLDVFAFLRQMARAGVSERLWTEVRDAAALAFRFPTVTDAPSTVADLARAMHRVPTHLVLNPPAQWVWRPDAAADLLRRFTPDNVLVMDVSSAFGAPNATSALPDVEPVYGTRFRSQRFTADQLAALAAASPPASPSPFGLPPRNPFLPHDLALLPRVASDPRAAAVASSGAPPPPGVPIVVAGVAGGGGGGDDDDHHHHHQRLTVWWLQDAKFRRPRVDVRLHVDVDVAVNATTAAFMAVYMRLVHDALLPQLSAGERAGFSADVTGSVAPPRVTVAATGYSDIASMTAWLQAVLTALTSAAAVTEDRFVAAQAMVQQSLEQALDGQLYTIALHHFRVMVGVAAVSVDATLAACSSLSFGRLAGFARRVLAAWRGQLLVHGNADVPAALALAAVVLERLPTGRPPLSPRGVALRQRHVAAVQQPVALQAAAPNPSNRNHVAVKAFQFGRQLHCDQGSRAAAAPPAACMRRSALLDVLANLISEPAFNTLRTQEQLGYVAGAYLANFPTWTLGSTAVQPAALPTDGTGLYGLGGGDTVPTLLVLAQGVEHDAGYIHARINDFLTAFRETLAALGQEAWDAAVAAVRASKVEAPLSLGAATDRYWRVIEQRVFLSDLLAQEVTAVDALSAEPCQAALGELLHLYDTFVANATAWAAVEVYGTGGPTPRQQPAAFPASAPPPAVITDAAPFATQQVVWY